MKSSFLSSTSPRVELATYISDNRNMYFYNLTGVSGIDVQSLINNNDRLSRYFTDFSNGYNRADQMIGNSTDYVLFEVSVDFAYQ